MWRFFCVVHFKDHYSMRIICPFLAKLEQCCLRATSQTNFAASLLDSAVSPPLVVESMSW